MDADDDRLRPWIPMARRQARAMERRCRVDQGELLGAALLGAWQGLARMPEDADPTAVMARSIRFAIVDQLRSEYGDSRYGGPKHLTPEPAPLPPSAQCDDRTERARIEDRDLIERTILCHLPAREAHILREHWIVGREQQDIAADLGICPSRVCQIHKVALRQARMLANSLDSGS